jgi:hypothetical protein
MDKAWTMALVLLTPVFIIVISSTEEYQRASTSHEKFF